MIITQAPQHQAVISNVETTGNFALKPSPKAFQILSSSLYANKIKAIIRELSCNAVDSHIAAGKKDTPFTVHLPNSIEPFFSIRDYGTGLSKDQVLNLYVTYFDSTKADSNDYIGAMGLGSKSPFSYTDNYSVTAIKDGVKGLYTAFIDDHGLPSIALMTECETDEPNGVEVKFAVNNGNDFYRFEREAINVYEYFELKPEIIGRNIVIPEREYDHENIVPGVHLIGNYSRAVMGNIAYPIDIPNSAEVLGQDLQHILSCGVEMHFPIGALDFQASREGLSYIPLTVNALRQKLQEVSDALKNIIKDEVEQCLTLWDKKCKLTELRGKHLFSEVAMRYHNDNNLDWFSSKWNESEVAVTCEDLAKKFNISVTAFTHSHGTNKPLKAKNENVSKVSGVIDRKDIYYFVASNRVMFVENDTKVGAAERAKAHWRKSPHSFTSKNSVVYVLNASDRKKPIDFQGFYDLLGNPSKTMKASELIELKKKVGSVGDARKDSDDCTIVELTYGYGSKNRYTETVNWGSHRALSSFDDSKTHYYLHFSGYDLISEHGSTVNWLMNNAFTSGLVSSTKVYAVRKADIEAVKAKSNWVNFEEYVVEQLTKNIDKIELGLIKDKIGSKISHMFYDIDTTSIADFDIVQLVNELRHINKSYSKYKLDNLNELYKLPKIDLTNKLAEVEGILAKYPMLQYVESYRKIPQNVIVNYVKQCNNALVTQ